uniref:EF-hand domain-containing protein n=1 Tax=Romanomermis culicivorax TaxID=13658 RepID=A0A915JL06_ROMCU
MINAVVDKKCRMVHTTPLTPEMNYFHILCLLLPFLDSLHSAVQLNIAENSAKSNEIMRDFPPKINVTSGLKKIIFGRMDENKDGVVTLKEGLKYLADKVAKVVAIGAVVGV